MNTMKMPGFTAEASLYKASENYQQQSRATVSFGVQAALDSTCGACTCDAGQCCANGPGGCACLHCAAEYLAPFSFE